MSLVSKHFLKNSYQASFFGLTRNTNLLAALKTYSTGFQIHQNRVFQKQSTNFLNQSFGVRFKSNFKMAKALVIGAEGSESSELIIITNILRRAKVATKLVASDESKNVVQCSDGTKIMTDAPINEALKQEYDAIILPGGMGARDAYVASELVKNAIKKQEEAGRFVGAICAAPTALISFGVGLKKQVTCYPALSNSFDGKDYKYVDQTVVVDGKLVTSQGPFTTFAFALKLAELLVDKKTSEDVKNAMLVKQ